MVGAAVGVPLGALLLGLTAFFLYRERRWRRKMTQRMPEKEILVQQQRAELRLHQQQDAPTAYPQEMLAVGEVHEAPNYRYSK